MGTLIILLLSFEERSPFKTGKNSEPALQRASGSDRESGESGALGRVCSRAASIPKIGCKSFPLQASQCSTEAKVLSLPHCAKGRRINPILTV